MYGFLDGYAAKLSCDNLTEQDYADMAFYIDAMELAINSGNYEMYYKQQTTFHQLYINKCGNNTLIDTIAKTKNKLLKKTYIDDNDQTLKEVLVYIARFFPCLFLDKRRNVKDWIDIFFFGG